MPDELEPAAHVKHAAKPKASHADAERERIDRETDAHIAARRKGTGTTGAKPVTKTDAARLDERIAGLEAELANTLAAVARDKNPRTARVTHLKQNIRHFQKQRENS